MILGLRSLLVVFLVMEMALAMELSVEDMLVVVMVASVVVDTVVVIAMVDGELRTAVVSTPGVTKLRFRMQLTIQPTISFQGSCTGMLRVKGQISPL